MHHVFMSKAVKFIELTPDDVDTLNDVVNILDEFDEIYEPSAFDENMFQAVEYLMGVFANNHSTAGDTDIRLNLTYVGKNIHAVIAGVTEADKALPIKVEISIKENDHPDR